MTVIQRAYQSGFNKGVVATLSVMATRYYYWPNQSVTTTALAVTALCSTFAIELLIQTRGQAVREEDRRFIVEQLTQVVTVGTYGLLFGEHFPEQTSMECMVMGFLGLAVIWKVTSIALNHI